MDPLMSWLTPAWIIVAPAIVIALGASTKGTSSMGQGTSLRDGHYLSRKPAVPNAATPVA